MSCSLRLLLSFLAAAAVAGTVTACATNPVTGGQDVVLMSEVQEIALGRKNDPEIRKQYGVYDDQQLQAYVNRVGQRLAAVSHRPGLKYHFTVLDGDEVNAFALPGGYVYITRGILAYLNSEAELAAVLGHEIGHVTARHSVRQYTTAVATGVGASILSVIVPELGGQAGQQLLDVLGGAIVSGYGRDHELESDRLGAQYLARAGYDSDAMIEVIGVLKNQEELEKKRAREEGREARVYHGVFASHPSNDQRLQEVVHEARRHRAAGAALNGRDEYLDRINGLVFGDSVREGIRRANRFYHRDLNFALEFPEGFVIENSPQVLLARSRARGPRLDPVGDSLIQVEAQPLKDEIAPREYLARRLKANRFEREVPLEGRYPGHGVVVRSNTPFGARPVRVVVVYYNRHAFLFLATLKDAAAFPAFDSQVLAAARSLRPLAPNEKKLAEGLRLKVIRAAAGSTFASLARAAPLNAQAEDTLRLLNDRFPKGEPQAGERIKVVE
jgi:predicted Zn-dependent protease